jgi:RES domain-containing protein
MLSVVPEPRFEEWQGKLRQNVDWFAPWTGDGFRFGAVRYFLPEDILSGEGSRRWGGRWNAAESFCAVYTCLDKTTAMMESDAHAAYYGLSREAYRPRLFVAVHFELQQVVDLRRPTIRRGLGVTLKAIRELNWRAEHDAGREAWTQALGRAIWACGAEGVVVPSAVNARGWNLVYFPEHRTPSSRAAVWDEGSLRRLVDYRGH